MLGSTAVSNTQNFDGSGNPPATPGPAGGYVRGVRYLINVPSGPPTLPYTITYAYAMVLENGRHVSEEQPMARAILSTSSGVIECASPAYYLPTFSGLLDTATAKANGFTLSPTYTPNASPNPQDGQIHLQDIWTKSWTEVSFDLSPYRGQQVTLTFEADNCVPGRHFSYAYFALRNTCAGLRINGDSIACPNNTGKYSIPLVNGALYNWSVPPGWTIKSDSNNNNVTVKVGPQPGWIVVSTKSSCTDLTDSLYVNLYKGALPEAVINPRDTTICYGGAAPLQALITTGTDYSWTGPGISLRDSKGNISSVPLAIDVTAAPAQTTNYILDLRNDGCPVTVSDTATVTVVQPIKVNPGNDTLVVLDQPLQFNATSNDIYKDDYQWTPSTDLSDPNIANPIGLYGGEMNSISYLVRATDTFGCTGTATVKITIAHTLPDIFVPNAFTPGMNSNNLFRPVCIGIATLDYFRVYNRWGQLVFSTSQMGQGWDGRIQGKPQETNAYLWIAKGTDYTGKVISKKGTVMLIR